MVWCGNVERLPGIKKATLVNGDAMLNSLIDQLKTTDALAVESLKRLYRSLALKLHPDITKESGRQFVQLQEEYEAALRILLSSNGSKGTGHAAEQKKTLDPRTEFLRAFYIFSIKYYGKHWRHLVPGLTRLADIYGERIGKLFSVYNIAFLQSSNGDMVEGAVAEANDILLTTIKRLACYYEDGLPHHSRLIESYLDELYERSKKLDIEKGKCIQRMSNWLREELNGRKVSIMTI
jgi:hypothetical protein